MRKPAGKWVRVTKASPCPVCGKPDWCMVHEDGTKAICPRTPEGGKDLGDAGYLHDLDGRGPVVPRQKVAEAYVPARSTAEWQELADTFRSLAEPAAVAAHAAGLGVSAASLGELGIGWCPRHDAWTFPMRRPSGDVCGIRIRREDGQKWAISGSQNGLFFGAARRPRRVLVVEGPTDAAAMLSLGLGVVGRPSARVGAGWLRDYCEGMEEAAILHDLDPDGVGRRGAEELASLLRPVVRAVRVLAPLKGKDARAWVQAGATPDVVKAAIKNTPLWGKE